MVWQRAGSVAVQNGSTTVVGTNVDFAASSRVGDSFIGPDGGNYEVANVASGTVISILPAYKGPTVNGAACAIMPVQGYDKMLSDAFNNLNNQFGTKLAALGTTGNYDILPPEKGGTGRMSVGTAVAVDVTTSPADSTAGRALRVADFGIGSKSAPYIDDLSAAVAGGQYRFDPATVGIPVAGYGVIHDGAYDIASRNFTKIITYMNTPKAYLAGSINGSAYQIAEFYTTENTTRAADGTLKAI